MRLIDITDERRNAIMAGGWRNAVTWKDGYGNMRAAVKDGPNANRDAHAALRERFYSSPDWPRGYTPHLRTVVVEDGIREYVEAIAPRDWR